MVRGQAGLSTLLQELEGAPMLYFPDGGSGDPKYSLFVLLEFVQLVGAARKAD